MTTKLTYRVMPSDEEYLARCEELPVESSGRSPAEAVEALRRAIAAHLASVEAVAPPTRLPAPPPIELTPAVEPEPDRQGPGDPGPTRESDASAASSARG
jgi:hypothetical protein